MKIKTKVRGGLAISPTLPGTGGGGGRGCG